MSRDWTGVKGIDPYIEDELCGVCGRPPHPCDDPECVAPTAPIAEKLRVAMRTVSDLTEALAAMEADRDMYRQQLKNLELEPVEPRGNLQ